VTDPQSSEIAKSIWDATLSAVHRAIFLAAAALAFAAIAVPGASSSSNSTVRAKADHITTRLRYKNGPWVTKLSLKLNKYRLNAFRVCGVFNWPAGRRFTCLGAGSQLPRGTTVRLEQSPIEEAMKRADSPGWGMVGLAATPLVKVVLSNTETGNHTGTFYYRVSLRDVAGKILLTSNKVKLVWHK
jgi:hypothetical protein